MRMCPHTCFWVTAENVECAVNFRIHDMQIMPILLAIIMIIDNNKKNNNDSCNSLKALFADFNSQNSV